MSFRRRAQTLIVAIMLLSVVSFQPATTSAANNEAVYPAARDFVTLQYNDFLGRGPDAGGLDFWAKQIETGTDPGDLIDAMVSAPEFGRTVAPLVRLYQAYFLRAPDFAGLQFWISQFRAGGSLVFISTVFADSPEFEQRYGSLSDADFVERVYNNVLGRGPDAAGKAYWVSQLGSGMSRGQVMVGFSESPEYVTSTFGEVRASMLYLGMLRRSPDASGLEYWASQIDSGVSYGAIVRGFLNSAEYQTRLARLMTASYPLTGEATVAARNAPALALKIDNAPSARPQTAINQADVVYEEMVEGNITRLVGIFHSQNPGIIGPIRSARTTDFDILAPLNYPLFGASGANRTVLSLLNNEPLVNVNAIVAGNAYTRSSARRAPHNLFANATTLWQRPEASAKVPPTHFSFLKPDENLVPNAVPSAGANIDFGKTRIAFRWSAARQGWERTQDGTAHRDSSGVVVAPDNVIVMITDYRASVADAASPEAVTIGSGLAWIFTQGQRLECYWRRGSKTEVIRYKDRDGRPCDITPGTTWVELAPVGTLTFP